MTDPRPGTSPLFSRDSASYGTDYQTHLLEQYKLFVESSQKVSEWRNATNNYFITVNAALAALYGLLAAESVLPFWRYAIPVAGIAVCVAWKILITSYKNLNTAKFEIIHELEACLPIALFRHEWTLLKKGRGPLYRPVSHVESWIPLAFGLLHIALACAVFFAPPPKTDATSAAPTRAIISSPADSAAPHQ
jgi:hypothetical protein